MKRKLAAAGLSVLGVVASVVPAVADDPPADQTVEKRDLTVPSPPRDVLASVENVGDDFFRVYWQPSLDNGGLYIQYYYATLSPGGQTCQVRALAMTMECGFNGLERNTSYTVTVIASNGIGRSRPSAPSNQVTLWEPPTVTRLKARDHRVKVSWESSIDSWDPVDFEVRTVGRKPACRARVYERSCVVWGLKNGRKYRFEVSMVSGSDTIITSEASKFVVPGRRKK
jgi:hypothetical protein